MDYQKPQHLHASESSPSSQGDSPAADTGAHLELEHVGRLTDIDNTSKRAEAASPTNAQVLSLLIDNIPGLVFTTKADGQLEWVNRTIQAYFGRSLEDLIAWQMADAVHPDDLQNTIAQWHRGAASGQPYEFEERLRRHDGVYRWFHFRAVPLRDDQGRLFRWCGLVTDIEDIKRAQEVSRASERNLRLFIDRIPGLVYTMGPACELEAVNAQVLEYFGRTFEELNHWDEIGCVHPDDLPRVKESVRRTQELGEPYEVEQRLRRADGQYRWFKPRSFALRDTNGSILRWYCLLSDIDDFKRAEEGLRSTQARLARAAQVAAVSELAASIAHEVNQPLAAIIANGHACYRWLSDTPPNVERALRSVERTIRDGNSAADIVSRIRSLFRHAPPAKLQLSLNEVIDEVWRLIADDLRSRSILLQLHLQPDLPSVNADRVQIQQVIANLARNGIDAMDGVQGRAKELTIASAASNGEIIVQVTDAGVGLEDAEAVFEPFFTTKTSGMGIGLAICKSILDAHGGRLWAMQNTSHGATFAFALPVVEAGYPS